DNGYHTIEIKATNLIAQRTFTINFTIDRTLPTIYIDDTIDNLVSNPTIMINGTYVEQNLQSITVDGTILTAAEIDTVNHKFRKTITIPSTKTIIASIIDKAGSTAQDTITITLMTGEPSLVINAMPSIIAETTYTITGTTEANADMIFKVNNGAPILLTSQPDGTFSQLLTLTQNINNKINITVTDQAERTKTVTKEIYVDKAGPTIVWDQTSPVAATGSYTQLKITFDDISPIDQTSINLTLNTAKIDNYVLDNKILTYDMSNLPGGHYEVMISVNDTLKNQMAAAKWSFDINNQSPSITIEYPDSTFISELRPTIRINLGNSDRVPEISKLKYSGGEITLIPLSPIANPYRYQPDQDLSENILYEFTVTAWKYNNKANLTKTFSVDRSDPSITIDELSLPRVTNASAIDVYGTYVEDNLESITVNGIAVLPTDIDDLNQEFTARNIPLQSPLTQITAVIKDKAGRENNDIKMVPVDRTPPIFNITWPEQAQIFALDNIPITFESEENATLYINGILKGTFDNTGEITIYNFPLSSGNNTLYVTVKDEAQNPSYQELKVYYDDVNPVISNIKPNIPQNTAPISIAVTIEDASPITNVTITIDDTPEFYYDVPLADIPFLHLGIVEFYPTDNSTYTITITAKDIFDNTQTAQQTFVYDTDIPNQPIFNLENRILNYSDPTLTFTYSEDVNLPTLNITAALQSSTPTEYNYDVGTLADNIYNIGISASKVVGSGAVGIYPFTFTIDTTDPIATITDAPELSTSQQIHISGTCSDNLAPDSQLEIIIKEGTFNITADCVSGIFSEDFILSEIDGDKLVQIIIKDWVNNTYTTSKTIRLDTSVPYIIIDQIIADGITVPPYSTNSSQVTINGRFIEDNLDTIKIMINGIVQAAPITYIAEAFHVTLNLQGNIGQETLNNIEFTINDTSGLNSTTYLNITKDLRGPQITEIQPPTLSSSTSTPQINITTNELASCTISYTTQGGQPAALSFTQTGLVNTVTLIGGLRYNPEIEEGINSTLHTVCTDKFNNIAVYDYIFTIDLKQPHILNIAQTNSNYEFITYTLTSRDYIVFGTDARTSLNVTTNESTTCRYSTTTTYFDMMENTFSNGNYQKQHLSPLLDLNPSNTYYVACKDGADNIAPTWTVNIQYSLTYVLGIAQGDHKGLTSGYVTISNPIIYLITSQPAICTVDSDNVFINTGTGISSGLTSVQQGDKYIHSATLSKADGSGLIDKSDYKVNITCDPIASGINNNSIEIDFTTWYEGPKATQIFINGEEVPEGSILYSDDITSLITGYVIIDTPIEASNIEDCFNNKLDKAETDIDCGGICPGCPVGKQCNDDDDCVSYILCDGGTCKLP
ncbi:MAG: Ig-like domain-containing protein, partial [Nanoarchaeota archaeon]